MTAQPQLPMRHGTANVITEQLDALPASTQVMGLNSVGKNVLLGGVNVANGVAGLDASGHLPAIVTVRKGTAAVLNVLVLADGEMAIEVDGAGLPVVIRLGDGVTAGGLRISVLQANSLNILDTSEGEYGSIVLSDANYTFNDSTGALASCIFNIAVVRRVAENTSTLSLGGSNINNWNPTTFGSGVLFCSSSAAISISGIMPASSEIWNTGSNNLTLLHESASSTSQHRFICPGASSFIITPGNKVLVRRDVAASRWRIAP